MNTGPLTWWIALKAIFFIYGRPCNQKYFLYVSILVHQIHVFRYTHKLVISLITFINNNWLLRKITYIGAQISRQFGRNKRISKMMVKKMWHMKSLLDLFKDNINLPVCNQGGRKSDQNHKTYLCQQTSAWNPMIELKLYRKDKTSA